jgi:Spherulation-specific family 4
VLGNLLGLLVVRKPGPPADERLTAIFQPESIGRVGPRNTFTAGCSRKPTRRLLAVLAAAVLVSATPAQAQHGHRQPTKPTPPPTAPPVSFTAARLLVPAYFAPEQGWQPMCAEMPAGSTAIANPDDGPGTAEQPSYSEAISDCQADGQKVIGYVYTDYGKRSLGTVEAAISDWYAWYPVNGIFLDEMAEAPDESYYSTLEAFIHSKGGTVVGNPGDTASTDWQLKDVDQVVTFEGTASELAQYKPASWVLTAPSSRIANIVYSATVEACAEAEKNNAGSVFVTNLGEPDPYAALPSYWTTETEAC